MISPHKFLEKILKIRIERLIKANQIYQDRFEYQKECVNFDIESGAKVLDLGSGNHPFPLATHLADLYVEDNFHRGGEKLVQDDRPMFEVDIESLPFKDKEFDFVYCSHVLEHVNNPVKACNEIMRVGKRGYIETPTRATDMLYNFSYVHKWYINLVGNTLIFIEYNNAEREGTNSSYFLEQHQNPYHNEVKELIYNNRKIFLNMFQWQDRFKVFVFSKEGVLI